MTLCKICERAASLDIGDNEAHQRQMAAGGEFGKSMTTAISGGRKVFSALMHAGGTCTGERRVYPVPRKA